MRFGLHRTVTPGMWRHAVWFDALRCIINAAVFTAHISSKAKTKGNLFWKLVCRFFYFILKWGLATFETVLPSIAHVAVEMPPCIKLRKSLKK